MEALFQDNFMFIIEDFSKRFIRLDDALRAITPENATNLPDDQLVILITARKKLKSAPIADAVEVVRCKDCKFYKDSPMGGKGCHTHFNGRTEFIPKNDNDFCSYGRKKIDEQKDC